VRRRLFLLLLEFLVITLALAWLWDVWGRGAYLGLFRAVAGPALDLLGVERIPVVMVRNRFIGHVPFFALMMVTPGLSARRRTVGTMVGFALIFLCQIGFTAVAYHVRANYGVSPRAFSALFPALLISDSFPFVVWAVVAHEFVRDVGSRAWQKVATPPAEKER
jgi:hypothetical protein